MDKKEALAVVVFLVFALGLLGLGVAESKKRYLQYYSECMSEANLSQFECKQAAHNMAYGE